MKQTSRNRYIKMTKEEENTVKDYKVLECFDFKLTPVLGKMKLVLDVSFRILNIFNALEDIKALHS